MHSNQASVALSSIWSGSTSGPTALPATTNRPDKTHRWLTGSVNTGLQNSPRLCGELLESQLPGLIACTVNGSAGTRRRESDSYCFEVMIEPRQGKARQGKARQGKARQGNNTLSLMV